jgi:hypothetical protein
MWCFSYRLEAYRCMNRARNPRAWTCFHGATRATCTTNHFVGRSKEGEGLRVRSNTQPNQRRNPTFGFATKISTSTIEA